MDRENIIKAIEDDALFDFIANNYWQMSKEDLKDILLELEYRRYEAIQYKDHTKADKEYLLEDLKNRWDIE